MAQKTRGSLFINFIILAAVLTVGYIVVVIFGQPSESKGPCTYLMTVTFNPTPQDPAVEVAYAIAGGGTKREQPSTSPWTKSLPARCGSAVVLTALVDSKYAITKHGHNMLNCKIQHGSKSFADSAEPGEQSVHCSMG